MGNDIITTLVLFALACTLAYLACSYYRLKCKHQQLQEFADKAGHDLKIAEERNKDLRESIGSISHNDAEIITTYDGCIVAIRDDDGCMTLIRRYYHTPENREYILMHAQEVADKLNEEP